MQSKTKVIVGISGGVDSAVAAFLLQEHGYTVEGMFMKNWEEDDNPEYCSASKDLEDAKQICATLNIPLHTVNFAAEYWDNVFEHFLSEYRAGRTPNPDILCNREIKFKAFLDYAKQLGASFIATGHYARKIEEDGTVKLAKSYDENKDQTYFLHALSKEQLQDALFPLADYDKPKVREIAKSIGFANFAKKDSTGICFIGERKFKDFLQNFLPASPGKIVTVKGEEIGKHDGLMYYTIGQRKGLHIGGLANFGDEPWYVVDKDLTNNLLIVTQGNEDQHLFKNSLRAINVHWINPPKMTTIHCKAKTRYRQPDQDCVVKIDTHNGDCEVYFEVPQRAITPGQSVVFYMGDICLGGGVVNENYQR